MDSNKDTNDDQQGKQNTRKNKTNIIRAAVSPFVRPSKKKPKLSLAIKSYAFPNFRSVYIDAALDYASLPVFRNLLNSWHCNEFITFPAFALEICTLFLRCHHSILSRENICTSIKRDLSGMIAALGWTYAWGYNNVPLLTSKSEVQSLFSLYQTDEIRCEYAMEIVQLLLAITQHSFQINLADVIHIKIGESLDEMIRRTIKNGVQGKNTTTGLYLPIYIVLRALHPDCPDINESPRFDITPHEQSTIYCSEPRLYVGTTNAVNLFPPASEDGKNYNLWYFYDCLQPGKYSV